MKLNIIQYCASDEDCALCSSPSNEGGRKTIKNNKKIHILSICSDFFYHISDKLHLFYYDFGNIPKHF